MHVQIKLAREADDSFEEGEEIRQSAKSPSVSSRANEGRRGVDRVKHRDAAFRALALENLSPRPGLVATRVQ